MGSTTTLEELISQFSTAEQLPQLPNSPLHLSELLDSPDTSPIQVERAIHADPALTAGLLRASSSVVFGRSRPVTSVKEAVMVLGHQSIRSLAVALWTNALVMRSKHKTKFDAARFAKNGAFVGALASQFLTLSEFKSRAADWTKDEAFAVGVMHRLPYGLLSLLAPEVFDLVYDLAASSATSLDSAFEELYKSPFSIVAAPALQNLGLPEKFFDVILRNIDGPSDTVRGLIEICDLVSEQKGYGFTEWATANDGTLTILQAWDPEGEAVQQAVEPAIEMAAWLSAA